MQMGVEAPAVTAIQRTGRGKRLTLIRNENDVRKDLALTLQRNEASAIPNPLRQPIRIGIYKGWMGNMDEGWTRFVFDTFNVPYKSLVDAEVKLGSLSSSYDVIVLPSQRAKEIIEGNAPGAYPAEFTAAFRSPAQTT